MVNRIDLNGYQRLYDQVYLLTIVYYCLDSKTLVSDFVH
jgi:hypothetical protein